MEEKVKGKRGSVERGEWFKGLDPFTEAQRSMIAEWHPYAMKYADTEINRRKRCNEIIPSHVIQDASEAALMYAVSKWKPDGGCNFKTFFHNGFFMRVNNAIKQYANKRDKYISENNTLSPMRKSQSVANNTRLTPIAETSRFSSGYFEDSVVGDIYVDDLLSRLTPLQRLVVERCYLEGERQSDVAKDLGTTKQNVNQALRLAKDSLKQIINGEIDRKRRGYKKRRDVPNAE
ncbi:MAG: sigma-70 family RNA polymerase sigma factor [Clostridia bacterium]|nr:sigma-70 family RNA polymerase sigma factor [Clostridia bacterium]